MTVNVKSNGRSYNLLDNTNIKFEYLGTLRKSNIFIPVDFNSYDLFIFLLGFDDDGYGEEKIYGTIIQTAKNFKKFDTEHVLNFGHKTIVPQVYLDYVSTDLKIHYYMEIVKAVKQAVDGEGIAASRLSYDKITSQVYGIKL